MLQVNFVLRDIITPQKIAILIIPVVLSGCNNGKVDENNVSGVDFTANVWPILVRECAQCHNGFFRGDFRTPESAYTALTDSTRAVGHICNTNESPILPIIKSGDPEKSGLWHLIGVGYHGCEQLYGMPKFDPRGILLDFDSNAATVIHQWITEGASSE